MWTACTVTKVGHGLHFGWRLMEPWDLDILWLPADSVPILYNSPGRWPLWEWNGSRNAIFFVSFVVWGRRRFPLWFLSLIIPTSFFPPSPPHLILLYVSCTRLWVVSGVCNVCAGVHHGQIRRGSFFLARQSPVCQGLLIHGVSRSHATTHHRR